MWNPSAVGAGILALVSLSLAGDPVVAQSPAVHAHYAQEQAPEGLFQTLSGFLSRGPGDSLDVFGFPPASQGCDMTCDAGCQFPCNDMGCGPDCCDGMACEGFGCGHAVLI